MEPEYVRYRPAAALRPWVSGGSGYRMDGPPGRHQGLPSGRLTLIFCLSGSVDVVEMPDPARAPGSFPTLLGGLHDAPAVIEHDGRQHGVQLQVTWRGARALFGGPAGELAGDVVDLTALVGARATEIAERLASAPTWDDRFAVLDASLLALADRDRAPGPPDQVARAWERLESSSGAVPVGALAAELGWSRRHLTGRFQREFGLSPKAAARVIRFEAACRLLRTPAPPPLADVAARAGYFDQAHMARDFRDLGGTTATAWLAELRATILPGAAAPA
ncbi:helix-turn-helix domain-containing protein [Actinomadura rupiterrae]|uniref:helix-turn-helix domain-containing protein n=1 Tax=Actinomadura rupiterrae TaxID=559627 RepID=UPI0020A250B1|nr:helix-turn-helix domain-containing protein [Actinomadura rupiterrae]MCP2336911.1 AraC-like DNA-binding protein [Actinomadura rupiterrae]